MKARDLIKFSLNHRTVEDPALPVGYIRTAYYNGLGRHVCQLQRVTIKFCKNSGTSRGVREFVESKLLDFSRANPGVAIYMKPRLHRTPVITAEYLNGQKQWMSVRNFSAIELDLWLNFFRTRSGFELTQLILKSTVVNPSTQGIWNPMLNRPSSVNVSTFPNAERGEFRPPVPSATQHLLDLVQQAKLTAIDPSRKE